MLTTWGVPQECGFHLIVWAHDDACPLDPNHVERHARPRCECQPDGTLVLHIGTSHERRIAVVRDGVALPVQGLAE